MRDLLKPILTSSGTFFAHSRKSSLCFSLSVSSSLSCLAKMPLASSLSTILQCEKSSVIVSILPSFFVSAAQRDSRMLEGLESVHRQIDPLLQHARKLQGAGEGGQLAHGAARSAIEQRLDHRQLVAQQLEDARVAVCELLPDHRTLQHAARYVDQLPQPRRD